MKKTYMLNKEQRRIVEVRRLMGLSQVKMARLIGVGIATYSYWEKGQTTPPPYIMPWVETLLSKHGKAHATLKQWSNEDVRELLVNSGMTQSQFADAVGVSRQTVHCWINDMGLPNLENQRLLDIFEKSITKEEVV